jgi:dCMP deaminase
VQAVSAEETVRKRPGWDEYFMSFARLAAARSTCLRRQVGAVIVRDRRIISTGYNGAPSGVKHCLEIGCLREQMNVPAGERHELCRGLHAEQNAIIQAALHGVSTHGGTIYCTHLPCSICAKMLINAGVMDVVVEAGYPDGLAEEMFSEAGVRVKRSQG